MKKSRFREEPIMRILKQHEPAEGVGSSESMASAKPRFTWKNKYGGLEVSEAQRLEQLEEENRRLKRLVADLSLDKDVLKAVMSKVH